MGKKQGVLKFLFLIVFVIFLAFGFFGIKEAKAGTEHNVFGWAWSENNIGWISFNSKNCDVDEDGVMDRINVGSGTGDATAPASCPDNGTTVANYGVKVDTQGNFSGYAWSAIIGWITFNSAELGGCPTSPCQAKLNTTTNQVSGWARALNYGGGWDGWIKLRAPDPQPPIQKWAVSEPSGEAQGIVSDPSGNYIYITGSGYDPAGWDYYWRTDKRNRDNGGLLAGWPKTRDPTWASEGADGIAIDSSGDYIYVAGNDYVEAEGSGKWVIERWKSDGTFGWRVFSNPSANNDIAEGVAVFGGSVYVVGYDYVGGSEGWRIEQRQASNGALLNTARRLSGKARGVVTDPQGNIYVVGRLNDKWWVEKRTSNLGLIWEKPGPSSGLPWDKYGVTFDPLGNYIYVVGSGGRIEKRSSDTGDVVWEKTLSPPASLNGVTIDLAGNIYVVGSDSQPGNAQWRIEKWNKDGVFQWVATSNPTAGLDVAYGVTTDNLGNIYVAGFDGTANYNWRIEKWQVEKYGITYNPSNAELEGWAWSDMNIGWLSFNCGNRGVCNRTTSEGGPSNYKVMLIFPPTATPLVPLSNYCNITQGNGQVNLKWTYNDSGGYGQSAYWLQIATNPGFTNPVVDYTASQGGVSPGGEGTTGVSVLPSPTLQTNDLDIGYGGTYYWQIKVQNCQNPPTCTSGAWSDWAQGSSFSTPAHAYPWPDFAFSPENPGSGEIVSFTDNSTCYDASNQPWPCSDTARISATYLWDFGDGSPTSDDRGNTSHTYFGVGNYFTELTITNGVGTCTHRERVPVGLLPKWKEVAPVSWFPLPSFVFQNLRGFNKFFANAAGISK